MDVTLHILAAAGIILATLAAIVGFAALFDRYGPPWRWPGSSWSWYR